MKSKLLVIITTMVVTIIILFIIGFFLFGLNGKPQVVLSQDSPDGAYNAYVIESPSMDPPNQSLFIARNGSNKFRLVDDLPEDIESVQKIIWSPDSRNVVFATNWYLIITNTETFNTRKISLNPDWWTRNRNRTFSSSDRSISVRDLYFINGDSLKYLNSLSVETIIALSQN